MMSAMPVVWSPARPSELLTHIISKCTYPTTLIVCSTQAEFLTALLQDVTHQPAHETEHTNKQELDDGSPEHVASPATAAAAAASATQSQLLAAPLFQVAIAKHIRVVFVPTVSHLRGYLSSFPVAETAVVAPPVQPSPARSQAPLLLVFGFLELHRDTSEWSAQGMSSTAAALVDAARETSLQPVVVEPKLSVGDGTDRDLQALLGEAVPVLSSGVRRAVAREPEDAGWTGRTTEVRHVLGRWFNFRETEWAKSFKEFTG